MSSKPALDALPRNETDRVRVVFKLKGDPARRNEPSGEALASLALETALPIRPFYSWPGKTNYEGFWWSSTTRPHIPFESLLERQALMEFDYLPMVVSVAAQPLAFLWPTGTAGRHNHVPDFFLRLASGDGLIVDVRGTARIDTRASQQFDLTRRACGDIGWQYKVVSGLSRTRLEGLKWLAGYRRDRFKPEEDVAQIIIRAFRPPCALRHGVERATEESRLPRARVLAHVYHLLWTGELKLDLDVPLSSASEVSS